jgi:hypothetical protein
LGLPPTIPAAIVGVENAQNCAKFVTIRTLKERLGCRADAQVDEPFGLELLARALDAP